MSLTCAHCRQQLDDEEFGEALWSIDFSPRHYTLLRTLVRAKGRPLHMQRIEVLLYSDNTVKFPRECISVIVSKLNRRIVDVGYMIVFSRDDDGYCLKRTPVKEPVWNHRFIQGRRNKNHGRPARCE